MTGGPWNLRLFLFLYFFGRDNEFYLLYITQKLGICYKKNLTNAIYFYLYILYKNFKILNMLSS